MVSDLGLAKSDHVIMPYTAFTDEEGHWKGRITLYHIRKMLVREQKLPVE